MLAEVNLRSLPIAILLLNRDNSMSYDTGNRSVHLDVFSTYINLKKKIFYWYFDLA